MNRVFVCDNNRKMVLNKRLLKRTIAEIDVALARTSNDDVQVLVHSTEDGFRSWFGTNRFWLIPRFNAVRLRNFLQSRLLRRKKKTTVTIRSLELLTFNNVGSR